MLSALSPKLILISFFLLTFSLIHAQTLEGTTGLFFIPTAEMQKDGTVLIGANFVDKTLISFSGYQSNAYTPFFSFTFLPFVEMGGKITRLINSNTDRQGIGDRTISFRLRFVEEGEYLPGLLFGFHDIAGVYGGDQAIRNSALYFVSSKNFKVSSKFLSNVSIHAGYGLDVIKAQHHNFVWLFSGIDFKFFNMLELMSEYDGIHYNGGIRVKLFDHVSLMAGWLRWKYFSGGAAVSFKL